MAELKAPKGKYRLVGVDTFSNEDWVEDDYDNRKDAIKQATLNVKGEEMLKMHVYDDEGNHVFECGKF